MGGGRQWQRQRIASMVPQLLKALRRQQQPPLSLSPTTNRTLPSLRRTFSLYDQINLIDTVPDDQLRFQGYSDTGFTINGTNYEGSLLIVENKIMTWAPKKFSDVTPQSLSIFQVVRPVPEIMILGSGRNVMPVDPELRRFIRSTGMKLEAVDSIGTCLYRASGPRRRERNASSTYNILNEEGRHVAAALLPYGVES